MRYRPNRRTTRVDAVLDAEGETLATTLLDISRDGARITLPYRLLPGTAVRLRFRNRIAKALVVWFRDGEAGLKFLDRLDRETLVAIETATDDADAFR